MKPMQNQKEVNEIEQVTSIQQTEKALKSLLSNISHLRTLEEDNKKLKEILSKDRDVLNKRYKDKISLLVDTFKKKNLTSKIKYEKILEEFRKINFILHNSLIHEKKKRSDLIDNYKKLIHVTQKLYGDREDMKIKNKELLDKLQFLKEKGIEKAVYDRTKELEEGFAEKLIQIEKKLENKKKILRHTKEKILKKHEETKFDMIKELELLKKKNAFLQNKHSELTEIFEKTVRKKRDVENINKKIISKVREMERNSISNEDQLEKAIEKFRTEFEEKLEELTKEQLDKEIEYKAKIDSLTRDLKRYHLELSEYKKKYYEREKKLKEKIKELF